MLSHLSLPNAWLCSIISLTDCGLTGVTALDEHEKKIVEFVFQAGTALAGLILIFLAASLSSFDTFDPTEQETVKDKYRKRAWIGIAGFFASLLSAVLSLASFEWLNATLLNGAVFSLLIAFAAISWSAIVAVQDIG